MDDDCDGRRLGRVLFFACEASALAYPIASGVRRYGSDITEVLTVLLLAFGLILPFVSMELRRTDLHLTCIGILTFILFIAFTLFVPTVAH